jgi:Trypsin-co-occurring domain 2
MNDATVPRLDLVEVLGDLRAEIGRAEQAARGKAIRFSFSSVRIELSVAIEKTATGKGGVKFWVVEAGAEAARKNTTTHLLAFDLQPVSSDTGRSPWVSGAPVDDDET